MKVPHLPIEKGMNAPSIQTLQVILLMYGATVPRVLRGTFLDNTERGVRELQERWGLAVTGIVDDDFITELREKGVDYFKVVENTEPHAPYYLTTRPHFEEGPGLPLKEEWILSPGRRFRLRGDRFWRICKVQDGSVEAMAEGDLPDVVHFNRNAFLREIQEELAPAEAEA